MIYHQPFPLKNLALGSVLAICALLSVYIIAVAIVSIWVGLKHLPQDGFWVPILVGAVSLWLVLRLFLRVSRSILNRMKEKDTIKFQM